MFISGMKRFNPIVGDGRYEQVESGQKLSSYCKSNVFLLSCNWLFWPLKTMEQFVKVGFDLIFLNIVLKTFGTDLFFSKLVGF